MFLPLMAGTTSLGNVLTVNNSTRAINQAVFIQKPNIEAAQIIAFNQVLGEKAKEAKMLEAEAEAIDSYFSLNDMPLLGSGRKMAEEALRNGLDWRLLPAIAVRESTGGKNDCKRVDNNPFGWASCKVGFDSLDEAIETIAKNLGGNNPTTEKHYANKTLKGILQAYNPPYVIPHYAEQVMHIMEDIGPENIIISANS